MQFMQFDAAVSKNYIFEIEIILYCAPNSVHVVNSTKRMSSLYVFRAHTHTHTQKISNRNTEQSARATKDRIS